MNSRLRCPICHGLVAGTDPEFPFCSARCRTQDLANWSTGKYVVHTPLFDPELADAPEDSDESPLQ
ncbi:MAG: DNA gyrase inhibitor YacG [Terriglobales bacterium]